MSLLLSRLLAAVRGWALLAACLAVALAGAAVHAASASTASLYVAAAAGILGVTLAFAALVERFPASTDVTDEGKVHFSGRRIFLLGVTTVGQTLAVYYMLSGQGAPVMGLAYPGEVSVAGRLFAFAAAALGAVGWWYLARSIKADPRNIAIPLQVVTSLVLIALAGLSLVLHGQAMAYAIYAGVVLTGACCWQQFALTRIVTIANMSAFRATCLFLSGWGSVAYIESYMVDDPIVHHFGVRGLLLFTGAVVFATSPFARVAPRHPLAGQPRQQSMGREIWQTAKETLNPLVWRSILAVLLVGMTLQEAYSPLGAAAKYWHKRGVPWSGDALTGWRIGLPLVIVVAIFAFLGDWFKKGGTAVQVAGALLIVGGAAITYVPIYAPQWGGYITAVHVVATELGADLYLAVMLAQLFSVQGSAARAAAAGLCFAKYEPGSLFAAADDAIQHAMHGFGPAQPVLATIGVLAGLALLPLAPWVQSAWRKVAMATA